MNIVIINGPNINLLGTREKEIYGDISYQELTEQLSDFAQAKDIKLDFYQSNHEGALIDFIQSCQSKYDGIIINAGAYTHTSIALLDVLLAIDLPTIEVHMSNTESREDFRKVSYLRQACLKCFQGEGIVSYQKALVYLCEVFENDISLKSTS